MLLEIKRHFITTKGRLKTSINTRDQISELLNIRSKHWQNWRQKQIDSSTIIVDVITPLSIMDRTTWQKINKEMEDLNNTINQLDLTDIYRTLHPKRAEYTLLSNTHWASTRIDLMLSQITIAVSLVAAVSRKLLYTDIMHLGDIILRWAGILFLNSFEPYRCVQKRPSKIPLYQLLQRSVHRPQASLLFLDLIIASLHTKMGMG